MKRDEIKRVISKFIGEQHLPKLRKLFEPSLLLLCQNNLFALATITGTDKWNDHQYIRHYEKHFSPLRRKRLNILEIGVGGDANPQSGGASLRMWKAYFKKSNIFSIDIHNKKSLQEKRIRIFQGSQNDSTFLHKVVKEIGQFDVVIDDGSHVNEHVITSFEVLFPLLKQGGMYAIEDIQTSYLPEYGGDELNYSNIKTIMGYFKNILDMLNHPEYRTDGNRGHSSYKEISSLSFFQHLVLIFKR